MTANGTLLLHRALRSITLRYVLAALLLFAQHGALTHALAHAGGKIEALVSVAHDDCSQGHGPHDHHQAPGAGAQCAFDLLYSELLGGALLVAATSSTATAADAVAGPAIHDAASVTALPYRSRGPPVRA